MQNGIDHIIVLAMENRSFDHILGYVPKVGELGQHTFTNQPYSGDPDRTAVPANDGATRVLLRDPNHSHEEVTIQIYGLGRSSGKPDCSGFVESYGRKVSNIIGPRQTNGFSAVLAWIDRVWGWITRRPTPPPDPHLSRRIMACFANGELPVLQTLAAEFTTCTNWFCSLPGETWPNRNFMVSGTSDWDANITFRPYFNQTIFEALELAGQSWRIYYGDASNNWVFPRLWLDHVRRSRFRRDRSELINAIRSGDPSRLPAFTFVEPDFGVVDHNGSNSMHPGNNTTSDADFRRGESMIAEIYEALRSQPALFDRTLFILTFDEHGGFYDSVPPVGATPPDPGPPPDGHFAFDRYGPRVPAIVINPRCQATIDPTVRDHTTILKTVGKVLGAPLDELGLRVANADSLVSLVTGNRGRPLPDLSPYVDAIAPSPSPSVSATAGSPGPVPDPAGGGDLIVALKAVSARIEEVLRVEQTPGGDAAKDVVARQRFIEGSEPQGDAGAQLDARSRHTTIELRLEDGSATYHDAEAPESLEVMVRSGIPGRATMFDSSDRPGSLSADADDGGGAADRVGVPPAADPAADQIARVRDFAAQAVADARASGR